MKKFLPILGILLILGGVFTPVLVRADTTTPTPSTSSTGDATSVLSNVLSNANGGAKQLVITGAACLIPIAANIADWSGFIPWALSLLSSPQCILELLISFEDFIITLANTGLAGIMGLFSWSVQAFVADMGTIITNGGIANSIQQAWQMVRDFANIAIIGGIVATAIGTILQIETYRANKLLARLIIAALLVNFSYFFTGAIIDASNYLGVQMYNNVVCTSSTNCSNQTISNEFTQLLSQTQKSWFGTFGEAINSIPGIDTVLGNGSTLTSQFNEFLQTTGIMICVLVAIFVFLSAFALLLGRFAALIFVLIASPIGIAGSAVPGLSKYAKEWWNILFSQAFFVPVLFILMGFSLRIAAGAGTAFQNIDATSSISMTFSGLMSYLLGAALMLVSLRVAKSMSNQGSAYLGDIYKGAQALVGWAPKMYTNALGNYAGAEVFGRLGESTLERYNNMMGTRLGQALRPFTPDRFIKKGLENVAKSKFGGDESFIEARDRRRGRRGEVELTGQRQSSLKELDDALPEAKAAAEDLRRLVEDEHLDPQSDPRAKAAYQRDLKARAALEKSFNNLTPEAYENLKLRDPQKLVELAPYLPSADFNRMIHDKDLPKAIRDEMKAKRFKGVLDIYERGEKIDAQLRQLEADGKTDSAEYKELKKQRKIEQSSLYNQFKRGGIAKADYDALLAYRPELIESEFFMDGGVTHGFKMHTQSSPSLSTAQQRLAKQTWRVGNSKAVKESAVDPKAQNAGSTWDSVNVESDNFQKSVTHFKEFFTGKQPPEVSGQVSDPMLHAPAFAAAATIAAVSDLPGNKDPVHIQALVDNLVRLDENPPAWMTEGDKLRIKGVLTWMRDNSGEGGSKYAGYVTAAEDKQAREKRRQVESNPTEEDIEETPPDE